MVATGQARAPLPRCEDNAALGATREDVEEYYGLLYRHSVNGTHSVLSPQAIADAQGAPIDENWWRRRLAVWAPAVVAAYREEPLPWRSKDTKADRPAFDVLGLRGKAAWWRMRLPSWVSAMATAYAKDLAARYRESHPSDGGGEAT